MINIHELNRRRREKKKRDSEIYQRVLKRCHLRIRMSAHNLDTKCVYTVPQYIPGLPLYSLLDCIRFLKTNLRKNGFKVNSLGFDQLFISWRHVPLSEDDQSTHQNQSQSYTRQIRSVLHPSHSQHPQHRSITQPTQSLSQSIADFCPPQTSLPPPPYRDIRDEIIRADTLLFGKKSKLENT